MSLLPRTNILSVLGVEANEEAITNLLAYCLNHSRPFQAAFLRSVCSKDPGLFRSVRAAAHPPEAGLGAANLLLQCEWEAGVSALLVCQQLRPEAENAPPSFYASEEFREALQKRLGEMGALAEPPEYVFLSLFPNRRPPAGLPWTTATYCDLLAGLRQFPASRESIAEQLVNDWGEALRRFYEHAGIEAEDRLAERLTSEDGLEGGFLSFQALFSGLRLPSWLRVDRLYRKTAGGAPCYAASLSKQHWHPAAMQQDAEGQWRLPAAKPYHVSLELLYDRAARRFRVQVRYEPPARDAEHPSERATERWMKQNLPLAEYEAYPQCRRRFLEEAARHGAAGLEWAGSPGAAARAEWDAEGKSVTQACVWLEKVLFDASLAIDRTLESLAASPPKATRESPAESVAATSPETSSESLAESLPPESLPQTSGPETAAEPLAQAESAAPPKQRAAKGSPVAQKSGQEQAGKMAPATKTTRKQGTVKRKTQAPETNRPKASSAAGRRRARRQSGGNAENR